MHVKSRSSGNLLHQRMQCVAPCPDTLRLSFRSISAMWNADEECPSLSLEAVEIDMTVPISQLSDRPCDM